MNVEMASALAGVALAPWTSDAPAALRLAGDRLGGRRHAPLAGGVDVLDENQAIERHVTARRAAIAAPSAVGPQPGNFSSPPAADPLAQCGTQLDLMA